MTIDTIRLCFDTNLIDLDLAPKSQECERAKNYAPIISQSFLWNCIEFKVVILLRLVSVMNTIFLLSRPVSIQGREPYLCDIVLLLFFKTTL